MSFNLNALVNKFGANYVLYNYVIQDFTYTCVPNNLLVICQSLVTSLQTMNKSYQLPLFYQIFHSPKCHLWDFHMRFMRTKCQPRTLIHGIPTSFTWGPHIHLSFLLSTIGNTILLGLFPKTFVWVFYGHALCIANLCGLY